MLPITPPSQNARLFRVVKSVKSIKLFTCRASGAIGNRTLIYDLQNHCNSRYTIAPYCTATENRTPILWMKTIGPDR